jgi:hypothetical protein
MSSKETIREYDSSGKCVHYRDSNGNEEWYEYDANGDEIHYKSSGGFERWYWEGKPTKDPIKILILASQLHSEVPQ